MAALNLAYQLAERPRTAAPAAAQGGGDGVQIDTLLARIDAAIGSDGHLL
jgi:hypothetical protein